jgi:hypothetical protein
MALNETLSTINIMVTNSDRLEGDNCVVALPLQGNGGATGARGGAQITIGKCAAKSVSVLKNDYFVQ